MSRTSSVSVPKGAKEVLRYFLRNPQAADSLDGVARWRLLDEAVHRGIVEVSVALSWLVQQGYLVEETGMGVSPTFSLNKRKTAEAEDLVGDPD